jgi:hypothetical protein
VEGLEGCGDDPFDQNQPDARFHLFSSAPHWVGFRNVGACGFVELRLCACGTARANDHIGHERCTRSCGQ